MVPDPRICISRTGIRTRQNSPMLGVVKSLTFTSRRCTPCLLPENCRPPPVTSDKSFTPVRRRRHALQKKFSKTEIAKIKRESLPWTPEPLLPKIWGYDVFGCSINDTLPEHIYYSFPDRSDIKYDKEKLRMYRSNTIHLQKMAAARTFTKCCKPRNPDKILVSYRDTAEGYIQQVCNGTVSRDEEMEKNTKVNEQRSRIQRAINSGSYQNITVNEDGMTRLHRYVWKGKFNKLQKYLDSTQSYGKVNEQDNQGRTALHFAASWGCSKTTKLLLETPNILINLTDKDGKTPLFKAIEVKSLPCVKLLVKHGAIALKPALDSRNPFEYALQKYGDEVFEILKYLYDEGGICDERKGEGQLTFLHIACLTRKKVNTVRIMTELIASGEMVNATEGLGRTPLILATQMGKVELVKLLLACCADVLHMDMNMGSAIKYAKPRTKIHRMLWNAINCNKKKSSQVLLQS